MHVPLSPIRCLYRGVDLYGKKTGVVSGDCRFTYAQFGERCERLAAGLIAAGVEPGVHTGDMGVWDEETYIHIVDRKKDIIISGGENISSIEVERAIFAHPAVLECAVVSSPDSQWGEVPAAYVVSKPGCSLGEAELCEFLAGRIARFKMPRRFVFSGEPLPKTGTGKIIKRELRETFWRDKERRVQG